ncbi:MAG TPA: helix-turn-helix domain-containing protein [Roseiarcus sp.]|nr:helix-turn-helix domain-containing protein [Roseiarcus sp.]
MNAKIIVTPKGERLAILPAEEYEEMRDALRHAVVAADYRAGREEGVTQDEMQALLAAPTPLAFWRKKRDLTLAALAEAADVAQREIEVAESGAEAGSSETMAKLAAALKVGVEDLVATE